jgi:hypothetical protein
MTELEVAPGPVGRFGTQEGCGAIRAVGLEPSPPWDQAVEKFLLVSRRYLFSEPQVSAPRDDRKADRSGIRRLSRWSGRLADSRG